MALIVNTSSKGISAAGTTGMSLTLTITNSANRMLYAGLGYERQSGNITAGCTVLASFGGTAMTMVASTQVGQNNSGVYYLINPPSGANALTFTLSGATAGNVLYTAALCVNSAAQQAPATSTAFVRGFSVTSASTLVLTPASNDSWVMDACMYVSADSIVIMGGTGQILVASQSTAGQGGAFLGVSRITQSGAPAVASFFWSATATDRWLHCALDISPFVEVVASNVPIWPLRTGFWGATA